MILLATALTKQYDSNGSVFLAKALIDQCSQSSFISESCCQRWGLKRSSSKVQINGVGDSSTIASEGLVEFRFLSNFDTAETFSVKALFLLQVSGYHVKDCSNKNVWNHSIDLKLVDPHYLDIKKVDVLLGS